MGTFQHTIEMYRAPLKQTTLVQVHQTPVVHSPGTGLVMPAPYHTIGAVVGEWRGKENPYFDIVSLTDSAPFQVS